MDAAYIAAKVAMLPRFRVLQVDWEAGYDAHIGIVKNETLVLSGIVSEPIGAEFGSAHLCTVDLTMIHGQFLPNQFNPLVRRFKLYPAWKNDIPLDQFATSTLYICGQNHRQLVELAIDPDIVWERLEFEARPALDFRGVDAKGNPYHVQREYSSGDPIPDGATIVEQSWDHVHCWFCNKRIDHAEIGYLNTNSVNQNEWVCTWCYKHAVEPRDLRPLLIPWKDRID